MRYAAFLVASLLAMLVAPNGDQDVITLNGQQCGLEGTASSAAGKDLNRHKNRHTAPDDGDLDAEVSMAALLAPGNDVNRFDTEKAARIRAFVVDVKDGGNKETCNCGASKPDERDTHIELGLAADVPSTQRVIVEVTPRLRMQMKAKGVNWSTAALKQKIKGKWVEVTGWLLFDTMHVDGAENTNPGGAKNWRATCWEIHPITRIDILDEPPAEAADFRPASLKALHRLHAANVARTAAGKKAVAARNAKLLGKFDKKELEEAEEEARERQP